MLWHITLTHKRPGVPSTPLVKRYAVVADDPDAAEQLALREAGLTLDKIMKTTINACQSGVIRIR